MELYKNFKEFYGFGADIKSQLSHTKTVSFNGCVYILCQFKYIRLHEAVK